MEVKILVPDGIQETLKLTEKEFSIEAKALLAAKLYELGRLSAGLAAELAGTDRLTFLSELSRYGTPAINLRDEEVTEEEIDKKQDEATGSIRDILSTWLIECTIVNQDFRNLLFGLGAGEIDVMVQAYEQKAHWVVLDDQDARRTARRLGFKPIGTIGLLLVGKKQARF